MLIPLASLAAPLTLWGGSTPSSTSSPSLHFIHSHQTRSTRTALWAASKTIDFGTQEFWDLCSNLNEKSNSRMVLDILHNIINSEDSSTSSMDWNQRDSTSTGDGYSLLHHASMNGNVDVVQYCLEQGAEPNVATFMYESTPLKWAASKGYAEIVQLLVDSGADQGWRDYFGYTPLQYACLGGASHVASILVGIDPSFDNAADLSRDDDRLLTDVSKLLKRFSEEDNDDDDVNAIDSETGFMPLHVACSIGRIDIVRALLELDAFADEPNEEGRTPLFFAAGCGHDHIVEELIDWGANIHAYTHIEKTIFHVATPGTTPLHVACEKSQLSCVDTLIVNGADVNTCNAGKETPLMIATQHGHLQVAELLDDKGADVNLGDDWNTTPLHTACRQNHQHLVSLLIEHGADVDACNNYNETPLHHACWLGRGEIAQILVDNGADMEANKNKDGQTPMDYAKGRGHLKMVAELSAKNLAKK